MVFIIIIIITKTQRLVGAECVHYASPNAVATIKTVISLSHFYCVYYSPRRTLPRVLNFCMQTNVNRKMKKNGGKKIDF